MPLYSGTACEGNRPVPLSASLLCRRAALSRSSVLLTRLSSTDLTNSALMSPLAATSSKVVSPLLIANTVSATSDSLPPLRYTGWNIALIGLYTNDSPLPKTPKAPPNAASVSPAFKAFCVSFSTSKSLSST